MSEESDQLKDITEKISKVMKYTDNDMNRAKQIVQGTLKDFAVIKGKLNFEAKGHSGIFLIFIHKHRYYLVDKFSLVQDSPLLATSFSLGDSWKAFFIEMNHALEKDVYIKDQVTKLNTQFEKEFSSAIISQMITKLENGDLTSLTIQMENICSYALGDNDFFLQVDFEEMSSLDYEEVVKAAIADRIRKKEEEQAKKDAEKKAKEAEQAASIGNDEVSQEKNRLILEGNAFVKGEVSLSPIKGKFISEIVKGDVILVKIKDGSQKAISIIKQLHLVTPEGKIKKAKGKVVFIKKTEKGFVLFVQIAPLAILEIMEEEEVKVECVGTQAGKAGGKSKAPKKDKSNLPIIIISSALTAIIVLILIVFVLS